MKNTTLKFASASLAALAFTAVSAAAGDGVNCDKKKHAMKTQTSATATMATPATAVLSSTKTRGATKIKKAYSFDDALKLCVDKSAADLQACIDYKTGKTQAGS